MYVPAGQWVNIWLDISSPVLDGRRRKSFVVPSASRILRLTYRRVGGREREREGGRE